MASLELHQLAVGSMERLGLPVLAGLADREVLDLAEQLGQRCKVAIALQRGDLLGELEQLFDTIEQRDPATVDVLDAQAHADRGGHRHGRRG